MIKESFKEIREYYIYTLNANKILLDKSIEDKEHIANRIKICKEMLKQIEWELKVLGIAEDDLMKEL